MLSYWIVNGDEMMTYIALDQIMMIGLLSILPLPNPLLYKQPNEAHAGSNNELFRGLQH